MMSLRPNFLNNEIVNYNYKGEGHLGQKNLGHLKVGAPKGGASKGGALNLEYGGGAKDGARKGVWAGTEEGPKFRTFFPSSTTNFFLSSLPGGLLVEFWWCFEAPGPSNVHVWSSRAVVAAPKPPGLHTTARELQTCTLEGPGASKHHENSTRKLPGREERKTIVVEEGKKCEIFGRSGGQAVGWRAVGGERREGTLAKKIVGPNFFTQREERIFITIITN